jgi:hypothetical protein
MESLNEFIDSINYAIFFMGASNDDQFNDKETREHLFSLREFVKVLNSRNWFNEEKNNNDTN